jgi:hypothetical protein
MGLPSSIAWASPESARDLRNAEHFYQVGEYQRSKAYFLRIKTKGTDKENEIARHFLSLSSLRHVQPIALPNLPPIVQAPANEDELAPERQTPQASESVAREDRIQLSGYLRNETAFRISTPRVLSKMRNLALVAATGKLSDSLSYKVSGRFFYDAVFDLTNHYSRAVRDDQRTDLSLRDTYLDYSQGNWDVRMGRQQIVWGEAVGLFYADVVNAKDLREFVLPDFDYVRIPQWGADVEYSLHNFHAEGVWLPILEFNTFGRPGADYFPNVPKPAGANVSVSPERKPGDRLENGEVGGRLSYRSEGWDASIFHFRTWDTFPIFKQNVDAKGLTLSPFHPRLTIDGFTVAKEFHDVVFKSEFVYNHPKYFLSTNPAAPDGLELRDYFDYLLGADYTFSGNWSTALQFSQRVIPHYKSTLFSEKRYRSYITFFLRRPFFDGRLTPEILIIKNVITRDVMVRPKVTWKIGGSWSWTTGLDLFGGASHELFGQYATKNRAYSTLRYDF